jgi:hypothetical protein
MEQASELFRRNEDHELLASLRAAGQEGDIQHAEQLTVHFSEHQEQLEEVSISNSVAVLKSNKCTTFLKRIF